jgi:hypothetical protein
MSRARHVAPPHAVLPSTSHREPTRVQERALGDFALVKRQDAALQVASAP